MATRKPWSQLSPTYKARLKAAGITPTQHARGANLQQARGQSVEARRTARRKLLPDLPSESTIRSYRRRARQRGVTAGDWQTAVDAAGLNNFDAIKELVRAKEEAHRQWRAAGSPKSAGKTRTTGPHRGFLFAGPFELHTPLDHDDIQDFLNDDDIDIDEFIEDHFAEDTSMDYDLEDLIPEWGDSWGYYH